MKFFQKNLNVKKSEDPDLYVYMLHFYMFILTCHKSRAVKNLPRRIFFFRCLVLFIDEKFSLKTEQNTLAKTFLRSVSGPKWQNCVK